MFHALKLDFADLIALQNIQIQGILVSFKKFRNALRKVTLELAL